MLCLAFLSTSFSNAQELIPGQQYSTGNIVIPTTTSSGSTWTGAVYQDQLTCWGYGDPGYCGPNAIVRPGNSLNFSYGSTYVYQQQHITGVLPSGSGLQVNGYNFSFMAKNGNGWDDGRTDQLTALVRFWDNTNGRGADNLLYGNSWNLSYKFNWTAFNYNETLTKPLDVASIGQVQYGFIGKDNNFWQGPYGPEIYDVKFSVKYSVDPCASNPMYSPTCAGYMDALAKLVPKTSSATVESIVSPSVIAVTAPTPVTVVESSPATTTTSTAPVAVAASTPTVATATPSANNPQPKAGEVASSGSKPTVSMSTIMSILSTESSRVGAVEKSAVANAVGEAAKASEQAVQQAEAVAGALTSQSVASSMTQTSTLSAVAASVSSSQSSITSMMGSLSAASTGVGLRAPTTANISSEASTTINTQQLTVTPSNFNLSPTRNTSTAEAEVVQPEGIKFGSRSVLGDYINDRSLLALQGAEQTQDGNIKRNVQPNEVANGVDIASIATQPPGFAAYSLALVDASFYAPKEIYKNQNNVDNVRALRQLGSDRLHQEMVNQQYK